MRKAALLISILCLFASCTTYGPYVDTGSAADWGTKTKPVFSGASAPGSVRFLVLSDIHGYNKNELVTNERALGFYNLFWGKKQDTSFQNTQRILSSVSPDDKIDIVLISGDMTLDGEKASHEQLAGILARFEEKGIPAYVTAGNHDINSPQSRQHVKGGTKLALSVSPAGFARIYAEFGFSEALSRDALSLSYAVEPVPGTALLVIDTPEWYKNVFFPYRVSASDGAVRKETFVWMESVLEAARVSGKLIIVMQHHPLEKSEQMAMLYERYGVAAVIAGHRHRYLVSTETPVPRLIAPPVASSAANAVLVEAGRGIFRTEQDYFRFESP